MDVAKQDMLLAGIDPNRVRGVVFDLGGVLLEGGPGLVATFGARVGLPPEVWATISRELFIKGDLWNSVERGETSLNDFAEALRERLLPHGVSLSLEQARNFMGHPGDPLTHPVRPEVVGACRRLHTVMPTALLTNNIAEWRTGWEARLPVTGLFDLVVDSSQVGLRKPEKGIYRLIEEGLGLPGEALLFVDDLGVNLKPARLLGWQTLKYVDTAEVLAVLERVAAGRPSRATV